MKPIYKEFTVKNYVYGNPKGKIVPVLDITFTPIYELIYKPKFSMYFKTYKLRQEAYNLLKNNQTAPNSTFEYIKGYKVYSNLVK